MNQYEVYAFPEVSLNVFIYDFTSFGPKGIIKKIVQFQKTSDANVYNLAFGNSNEDGTIDDLTINNNKDRDKILATVASIVIQFTNKRPDCYIVFSGSTVSRTRLYRIAISINYNELSRLFNIWGLHEHDGLENFNSTRPYYGFLIKRK